MRLIKPPFTEQEKKSYGKQLVELDQSVKQLLQKQKQEIQQDLKQLNMKKESDPKIHKSIRSYAGRWIIFGSKSRFKYLKGTRWTKANVS